LFQILAKLFSKIKSASCWLISRGFSSCQTLRPTATPTAPTDKISPTIFKKSSRVSVFGPPDITTLAFPAALTTQAKSSLLPL
jgi:hypothetical protein